jgi:cytochrome P450
VIISAIRKILIEDHSAYRKSAIERRVLASRMPNGLVSVGGGEQWQRLRRTLAPLFGRTMTAGFAPAIARVAADLVERWENPPTAASWRSRLR